MLTRGTGAVATSSRRGVPEGGHEEVRKEQLIAERRAAGLLGPIPRRVAGGRK